MSRIYLVRHGRAAAGWGAHVDPGLDDVGRAQAEAMAKQLAAKGPLPLIASPLRRTRETAAALERQWKTEARIEPRVGADLPNSILDKCRPCAEREDRAIVRLGERRRPREHRGTIREQTAMPRSPFGWSDIAVCCRDRECRSGTIASCHQL